MGPSIYLDHNATTPLAPEALEAMLPWFRERAGNPSSAHHQGLLAAGALEAARTQVAALLGAEAPELVFTSGGTEALNHAWRGLLEAFPGKRHVVTTAVEHAAVLALAAWARRQGVAVDVVGVDAEGRVDLAALEAALRPDTAFVSLMAANNETGVLQPVGEAGRLAHAAGALLVVDAVQAAGRVPVHPGVWAADLVALSAHKLHGPKGVGALWVRRGLRLPPFVLGGGQEGGRRGGTENLPGIVGFGVAARLALEGLEAMEAVRRLRDRLEAALRLLSGCVIHGAGAPRLPNTLSCSFAGVEGEALLLALDAEGVCASTGSACAGGRPGPSHVLTAMGVDPERAKGHLRLSLGRGTTEAECARVAECLPRLVAALRGAR